MKLKVLKKIKEKNLNVSKQKEKIPKLNKSNKIYRQLSLKYKLFRNKINNRTKNKLQKPKLKRKKIKIQRPGSFFLKPKMYMI